MFAHVNNKEDTIFSMNIYIWEIYVNPITGLNHNTAF